MSTCLLHLPAQHSTIRACFSFISSYTIPHCTAARYFNKFYYLANDFQLRQLSSVQFFSPFIKLKFYVRNSKQGFSKHSSNNVKEDKRLIQDISLLKETMEKEEIVSVTHVPSKNNLADALTKRGASCQLLEDVLSSGSMVRCETSQ